MSRLGRIAGVGAVAALVTGGVVGVVWWQARGSGSDSDDRVVAGPGGAAMLGGSADRLADVGDLMSGRRPNLFVGLPWVVAASGTDFELGNTETLLAVSDDSGRSFRAVEFGDPVAYPNAVVHGDTAVLVGYRCEPPQDRDSVCEPTAVAQVAYRVDLAGGGVEPLEPAPIEGTIYQAIGAVGDRSVFFAQTDEGERLVTLEPDGSWSVAPAPAGADSICAVGDALVAVVSAAPFGGRPSGPPGSPGSPAAVPGGPDMPEVGRGEPLWSAVVSQDGGATWGEPVPFASTLDRDFAFALGVTCGPRHVMANTAQLAAFDPESGSWSAVEMPAELRGRFAPDSAAAWATPGRFVTWTLPSAAGPPPSAGTPGSTGLPGREALTVEVTGIGGPSPVARAGPAVDATANPPSGVLSPSAQATGFVVQVGPGVTVGRVRVR